MSYVSSDYNNINRDAVLSNNMQKMAEAKTVDTKSFVSKNPYAKAQSNSAITDISQEAQKLYEKEKDVSKFKNLLMDNINEPEDFSSLDKIFSFDDLGVTNDQLSSSMVKDKSLLKLLYSE